MGLPPRNGGCHGNIGFESVLGRKQNAVGERGKERETETERVGEREPETKPDSDGRVDYRKIQTQDALRNISGFQKHQGSTNARNAKTTRWCF